MSKGFLLKKSRVQIPTTQQILHHVKKISFNTKDIFFYTQTQKDGFFLKSVLE